MAGATIVPRFAGYFIGMGLDFRAIAEESHIAPATVRNHLQAIYAKLGACNKVEMSRIILEAED